MEPPEQADAMLALRHRQPQKDVFIGADKFKDRIKVDTKLDAIKDKKDLTYDYGE